MIRKYQKSDLDALMQIWLEDNLDAHDFIDPSYWHDNYELVKKEINQETSAADCLMEWDA